LRAQVDLRLSRLVLLNRFQPRLPAIINAADLIMLVSDSFGAEAFENDLDCPVFYVNHFQAFGGSVISVIISIMTILSLHARQ